MAQVKVEIDGVPYYGTVDGADDLSGAILQLRDVLRDHGAPVSARLKDLLEHVYAYAMGKALGDVLRDPAKQADSQKRYAEWKRDNPYIPPVKP